MTIRKNRRTIAALSISVLAAAGLGASASAAGDHEIRQSDLVTGATDTRASGAYGFGPKGLVVETKDSSSQAKVAEYFALTGGIPASGSYVWDGSQNQPGAQIVFDVDGTTGN